MCFLFVYLVDRSVHVSGGSLGWWLAPLPCTLEFGVRFLVSAVWKKQNVSSPSTWETQYCGEPPWPRGSMLGLRPPGHEFRILCLEDSVISSSSGGSPGPVYPICAQKWPKAGFIAFCPCLNCLIFIKFQSICEASPQPLRPRLVLIQVDRPRSDM